MKYFYYFLALIIALAGLYTLFGIGTFAHAYYKVKNPSADFQVFEPANDKGSSLKIIDFTNYKCGGCKRQFPLLMELRELHPDVTYIPRPITLPAIPDAPDTQEPAPLVNLVIAAGLQDRFTEFHTAFMEYPEAVIPPNVIEETAQLYGVDYTQLVKDAKSKKVQRILENNNKDMNRLSIVSIPSYILDNHIYIVGQDLPDLPKLLNMVSEHK